MANSEIHLGDVKNERAPEHVKQSGTVLDKTNFAPIVLEKPPSSPREFFARLYGPDGDKRPKSRVPQANIVEHSLSTSITSSFLDSLKVPNEKIIAANMTTETRSFTTKEFSTSIFPFIHTLFPTSVAATPPQPILGVPAAISVSETCFPPGFSAFLARKRRKEGRGPRRQRTTFNSEQTMQLEFEFSRNEYISRGRRCVIAQTLGLSETQIKIWFQNRRAKDKRIEKAHFDQQCRNMALATGLLQPTPPGYVAPTVVSYGRSVAKSTSILNNNGLFCPICIAASSSSTVLSNGSKIGTNCAHIDFAAKSNFEVSNSTIMQQKLNAFECGSNAISNFNKLIGTKRTDEKDARDNSYTRD